MAVCTSINANMNETSTQFHPHPTLNDLRNMCQLTLNNVLNIDITNHFQLVEKLARSLSVEGVITVTKTKSRTNSFSIQQSERESRLKQIIEKDSCSTAANNEPVFISLTEENDKRYYSTKRPYEGPSQEYILSSPPAGYKPISVQILSRHGSRALTGNDSDLESLKIWHLAKQKNMLTSFGEQLEEDINLFMDANNRIGRGELTEVGREEQVGLGTRLYNRLKPLFTPSSKISVMSSGKKRAVDSSQEFLNGLTKSESNLQIINESPNKDLLYFHKENPTYVAFKKTDQTVKTKLKLIKNLEQISIYARRVLKRIYKNEFIELLINGNYAAECDKNEVDVVLNLYSMFSVAPAQRQPNLAGMLAKYFNEEESKWFAYLNDAQEFYLKGPSIEGTTITFDMAKPLLIDFFASVSASAETNSNLTAQLRFAHAETIIPFASLLQIPDFSDQAVSPLDIYTYENNNWRGEKVAPMGANIQWEVYRHEDNHNQLLVRMLYNEIEVRFKQDCKSVTPDSFFYDFNELKSSYATLLSS